MDDGVFHDQGLDDDFSVPERPCLQQRIDPLRFEEIAGGMLPFFLVDVGMLMVVTFVPLATLWLPQLIVG